ncbi:uncharacterized protein TRUGW13939_10032 [Talaromyces rugulosus]|uniref:Xylanolytic transcriptional activator regulatory domain-containing protein n=1 Tax=Talaromyces rugulosus TaxID=121627 RepID=A0A7H8R9R1_TALRU|nr:uncharacterized protein TRUGW13939_10032 [Talaromyces rugulosus]QKX62867.1 hypothetical protein TRUGW13939_10032 [Talaromyces rugulosus]
MGCSGRNDGIMDKVLPAAARKNHITKRNSETDYWAGEKDNPGYPNNEYPTQQRQGNMNKLGFGVFLASSMSADSIYTSPYTSPQVRQLLCDIYFRNVDPLFKILHQPSIQKFLRDGECYLDYERGHQVPATLASAIYFAAVCSLDNSECQSFFHRDKRTLVALLQKKTEAALVEADCATSNHLAVLQAYVLSLLATRSQDQSRRIWTMLSMALRMAQALSLHKPNPPFPVCTFEQEMRRRLWLAIGLLDVSVSLNRATEPMMQTAWLQSHPPSNVNDDDIWFDMDGPVQELDDSIFTDMSFSLILSAAQNVIRSIGFSEFTEPSVEPLALRHRLVHDFQQTASRLLRGCMPDSETFHWYTKNSTRTINAWLQLISFRPLLRSRGFVPPTVPGDYVLRLAAETFQRMQEVYSDPRASAWRWFECMWIPWHGLAVAMAELRVCEDPVAMAQYYPIVEQVYSGSSSLINDTQSGIIRKPMENLMSETRAKKSELLDHRGVGGLTTQTSCGSSSNEIDLAGFEVRSLTSLPLGLKPIANSHEQIPYDTDPSILPKYGQMYGTSWILVTWGLIMRVTRLGKVTRTSFMI